MFNQPTIRVVPNHWDPKVYHIEDNRHYAVTHAGVWTNLKRCKQTARRVAKRRGYGYTYFPEDD